MNYPLVTYKKLLNIAIEIVSFPMEKMVIFNSYVNVYQRVTPFEIALKSSSNLCGASAPARFRGGVGLTAVQYALRLGATVYATAGREEFGAAGAIGRWPHGC